ncbi:MAG TPA: CapA family protein [Mobilitalea sp.]|nr:CapA family protein [Mobilitalea sp.]
MKAKNIFILSLVCLLSLAVLSGIVIYSFQLQELADSSDISESPVSPDTKDSANSLDSSNTTDTTDATDQADTSGSVDSSNSPDATDQPDTSDSVDNPDAADTTDPHDLPDASVTSDSKDSYVDTGTQDHYDKAPIILAFAGDINFDEDSKPVARYDAENNGILGCLSPELVKEMNSADIMMLNNEFAYSLRGTETPDKSYTFRADPKRVDILKEMGVDIVSLANNHTLDFGMDALYDTFTTLEGAEIDYVGAGINLDRAKSAVYYTLGDMKIAYLAASRVVFAMDWYANDTRAGMIGTYDPTLLLAEIKEAEKNSDFVVVYVHWGVERTNYPVDYQKSLARQYIDAGADAVIGCHPHVMQGLEYYNGKPIAYSLGNYWFNNSTRETALLKLYLNPDGSTQVQLLPAMSKGTFTYLVQEKEERDSYFEFMEEISYEVEFDEDGYAISK